MSKAKINNFKGQKLKAALRRRKMTNEKFAAELGVSTQTVTYWITDKKKPTAEHFEKFEKILDHIREYFLGYGLPCSREEYNKISEDLERMIKNIDNDKPFFEFILSIGKKYKTFDFDRLDKGFSIEDDDLIFNLIKKDLEDFAVFLLFKYKVMTNLEKIEDNTTKREKDINNGQHTGKKK